MNMKLLAAITPPSIYHFQFPDIIKIHGEPTYPHLQLLLNQIKSKALPVQSDLVGVIHGHIRLVLILEYYEEVSPSTTYNIPLIPTPIRIPSNTKIHKTQLLQEEFKDAYQLNRKTFDIEKALTKEIVATIEKKTFM